ncbi:hypothetical protein ABH897_005589 [Paenibacillus sp. RC73]|uniref:hypothetical protein n=1 Tax=Paenibacillus sp. RC73 TaxID=3156250 RepID=UPI00383363D9
MLVDFEVGKTYYALFSGGSREHFTVNGFETLGYLVKHVDVTWWDGTQELVEYDDIVRMVEDYNAKYGGQPG